MRASKRHSNAAFTLMELLVVVSIVGLMLAAGTFALRNLMLSQLRGAATQMAGVMRLAFDRALVTGKTYRLAIAIDKREMWLEVSEERVALRKGREQNVTTDRKEAQEAAARAAERKAPRVVLPFGLGGSGSGGGGLVVDGQAMMSASERELEPVKRARSLFEPAKGIGLKRVKLPGGVRVEDVMTPRLDRPDRKGTAYVYFFPQGHAEPAIVRLRFKDSAFYSVVLHPLTGHTKVYPCRYRIPQRFGEETRPESVRRSICEDPA